MRLFLLSAFLVLANSVFAQLQVSPIIKAENRAKKNTRSQSQAPLTLPFWDDFSFTEDVPHDSLWQNSENVRINADFGFAPPSINVASFDGLTVTGEVYNANPDAEGETDVLTSCPIDLSGLDVGDNVYLSFFYQRGGNGPSPESAQGDSLTLEFLSIAEDTLWVQVWPENSSKLEMSKNFVQEIIRVDVDSFFHENFQFRLRSFGRQSGIWDTWNVDYVYMNDDRNENDLFYPDRNVTSKLSSPFGQYTSIPSDLFSSDIISLPQFTRFNLESPSAISTSVNYNLDLVIDTFKDSFKNSIVETVFDPLNNASQPQVTDTITTTPLLTDMLIDPLADSIFLHYIFKYGSSDTIRVDYDNFDFRVNDTTQTDFVLKDYYAYDDGTAEFGAGFQFSSNRIAVQFELPDGVTDSITGMDMYFPYIGLDPSGKLLDLIVLQDNNGEPGAVLYQERISAIRSPEIDQFVRYNFRRPVEVSRVFYVGYRQNFDGEFRIGLDRNTFSVDRMFTNTNGFWEPENDLEVGSLMIRPVFGVFDPSTITSLGEVSTPDLQIYPNPSPGKFYISSTDFDEISIFDLRGAPVKFDIIYQDSTSEINIFEAPQGLYIIRVQRGNKVDFYKVLKE